MSRLTFRNSQGQLVDITSVAATRAKNEFGTLLDEAVRGGAVAITRHERPRAVLISYEEFEALVQARARTLGALSAEFDALLAVMQTPAAREGVSRAFAATPAELGRAAVQAARAGAERAAASQRASVSSPAARTGSKPGAKPAKKPARKPATRTVAKTPAARTTTARSRARRAASGG